MCTVVALTAPRIERLTEECLMRTCFTFVLFRYNHSTEDAEIYREFLTIATRIMPEIFKAVANENRSCCEGVIVDDPVDGIYQPDNLLGIDFVILHCCLNPPDYKTRDEKQCAAGSITCLL